MKKSLVALIMGSRSDWEVLKHTADTLEQLQIHYEVKVVSAHRTPDLLFEYVSSAQQRGFRIIIAGAGGAAHLPGMAAAKTTLPVLGVPIPSTMLQGWDSLLSIVQMPAGVPVATFAIGKPGAINAAMFAGSMLASEFSEIQTALNLYREQQTQQVLKCSDPRMDG